MYIHYCTSWVIIYIAIMLVGCLVFSSISTHVDHIKPNPVYIPVHCHYGYSVHQCSEKPGFNSMSSNTKDLKKWHLMPPCLKLSIIRYGSRVSGAIQGKELRPSLHHGVVAIEKGGFGSPSTVVSHIYIWFVK